MLAGRREGDVGCVAEVNTASTGNVGSVLTENIKIRRQATFINHHAKHVWLERIKIKLGRIIAYRAQQVDTPTKSQQQQKTNANIAGKENLQHNPQALQSFIFLSPLATVQMPTLSQRH